ncbi:860_t:CDS:2, partial [Scutellospora calospora]
MEPQNTISSIYSALENIPLILAPQFSALQPVTMPHDFTLDLPPVNKYDFNLERHIIADSERFRQENATLMQMRAQKLQALQDARIRKQKEEARKIAPGFLDTDQRLLTPMPMHTSPKRISHQIENGNIVLAGGEVNNDNQKVLHGRSASDELPNHVSKPAKSLVYLEFEESLTLRDSQESPNTIQNQISTLPQNFISNGLAMSSTTTTGLHVGPETSLAPNNFNKFHLSPRLQPVMTPPVQQQSQAFTLGSSLSNN